jgi:hypothetical protein
MSMILLEPAYKILPMEIKRRTILVNATFQAVDEMAILVSILDSNCATGQETDHEQRHRRSLHYAYQPFRSPACRCDKADNHADRVSEPTVPPGTSSRQVQSDKSLSNST